MTKEELMEMSHLKQDIDLFLRAAATRFEPRDQRVINRLLQLAAEYCSGKDIMRRSHADE